MSHSHLLILPVDAAAGQWVVSEDHTHTDVVNQ